MSLWKIIDTLQGGHIKIHSHSDIPVQVDGEPWIQPPGDVVVFNSALKVSVNSVVCNYFYQTFILAKFE